MIRIALAAGLAMLVPFGASAQTTDQLIKGATDTSNVLNYGMGYNLQRFSPLTQINKDNAKNLVPVWNYSLADDRSEELQPLVYQGIIYVTTHAATIAVDAKTGKQVWKTKVEYPAETPRIVCCGIINRGAAIYDGKLFRTTLDANVIALDAATGKELWRQKAADIKEGYSMTVAPLVADGIVLTGISGQSSARAVSSTDGIRRPASICGAPIRYPRRTNLAAIPGRATPGSWVADRPGSPALMIPS